MAVRGKAPSTLSVLAGPRVRVVIYVLAPEPLCSQHFSQAAAQVVAPLESYPLAALFSFYEGPLRVQHLAQGHFGIQMGKNGIELPTFWLEDNRSTTRQESKKKSICSPPPLHVLLPGPAQQHAGGREPVATRQSFKANSPMQHRTANRNAIFLFEVPI
ncbi:unnamed protein product [Pleuronectes platessa]|uniref:Uncharacterized protein n=1 Tax=Pleuronectes platessa TaxID=8262 RepID=A0A9N7Z056_PLEPL|nr:unnamed protein product [Pleuronectes platessa]